MCGICGVFDFRDDGAVDAQAFAGMVEALRHRGPDDRGEHVAGGLAIGMRRLSIIDLEGGGQPIYNEDGSLAVVFNGEIYNYRELAQRLQSSGHRLATLSDTEVIVHLYEEFGVHCVDHLRGMFAFAIWDARRHRLFIARDRMGIKPLYYTQIGNRLLFASEIKSILRYPGVNARPNLQALGHYLALRYVPAPQTMFEGILSLPPGHHLLCDAHGLRVRAYWDLVFANDSSAENARQNHGDEREYADQLESLLRESVQLHLRSDVPFGAFLSGGVDSSIVVALMSEYLSEPVKTFSVGFEPAGNATDERRFARIVAKRFGTNHHEIVTTPRQFVDLAATIVWHLDQPIADQATIATYLVSKLAAQHVKMVLTGEGGDELFAGYARYSAERLSPLFRYLPKPVKSLLLAASDRLPGLRRPKVALYALCQSDEMRRLISWFPLFNNDMKSALMSSELQRHAAVPADSIFSDQLSRSKAAAPLNRMLYVDTKLWLSDYLLLRGDKLTMAASLEGRVPLLDHKLVEFAATVPERFKLNGITRKYLLKKVSGRWLSPAIVDRKKAGFPIPISAWFRAEAREFIHDLLSPDTIAKRGLFDPAYVQRLFKEHDSGRADHGILLWGLANVELWYRAFIDYRVSERAALPYIAR